MSNTYEKEYKIRYNEIDVNKKLLMTSLMTFFEDIAMEQAQVLGIGLEYLEENHMTWVLYKWDITMKRYPCYGETVRVKTTPYAVRKFYASRMYQIFDEKGEEIGNAKSLWFMIDINKRRPIRISEYICNKYGLKDSDEMLEIPNVAQPTKVDSEEDYVVRYADIDTNRHVNNERYLSWMIEAVPLDIVTSYMLSNIKIMYKKETLYGEAVKIQIQIDKSDDEVSCTHKIVNSDGKELTLAKTIWKKDN